MSIVLLPPMSRLWHSGVPCVLLCVLLLINGCGVRQTTPLVASEPVQTPLFADGDDGIPLSSIEMQALRSTGQLDKNLSNAALQDVAVQFKYFLRKARTTMERFSQRSEPYLPYARKVFRDRGMPEELAFLAIVESGYNAKAVSPAGAAGAWQFMPYTGMKYGLNQDWWMDERMDPYKAAEAAADYLAKLYKDFRDWHLAVAAYNAGEGKISRALEGTGAKNFFDLVAKNGRLDTKAQLREETKNYVPRFLAISKIMRNLESLGFQRVDMQRPASVGRIEVRPGTDLTGIAAAVNMSWAEFSAINLAHKRQVTHADRSSYVYVPIRSQGAALAQVSSGRDGKGWKMYVAGKGDTWQTLSRKTGVPMAALQSSNKANASLRPGSKVRLPDSSELRMPAPAPVEVAAAPSKKQNSPSGKAAESRKTVPDVYVVRSGDTLTSVARMHDTSISNLRGLNSLEEGSTLRIGQSLRVAEKDEPMAKVAVSTKVSASTQKSSPAKAASVKASSPAKASSASPAATKHATYTVQPGDTLWSIARRYNLSTQELLTLNGSDGKAPLRPGVRLLVSEQ